MFCVVILKKMINSRRASYLNIRKCTEWMHFKVGGRGRPVINSVHFTFIDKYYFLSYTKSAGSFYSGDYY